MYKMGDQVAGIGLPFVIEIGVPFKGLTPIDDSIGIIYWSHVKPRQPDYIRKTTEAVYLGRVIFQSTKIDFIPWLLKVHTGAKE